MILRYCVVYYYYNNRITTLHLYTVLFKKKIFPVALSLPEVNIARLKSINGNKSCSEDQTQWF